MKSPMEKIADSNDPISYSVDEQISLSEWIHIFVAGEEWTAASNPISYYTGDNAAANSTDSEFRVFWLNLVDRVLEFGHSYDTMAPPEGCDISIYFESELLFPSTEENNHIAKLNSTPNVSEGSVIIEKHYPAKRWIEIIPEHVVVMDLEYENITDTSSIEAEFGVSNKQTFVNGKDEFSNIYDWSIDTENGTIYLNQPTDTTNSETISYEYEDVVEISDSDWKWTTTDSANDSIEILENGWETFEEFNLRLPTTDSRTVLGLKHFNVVEGSLVINSMDSSGEPLGSSVDPFILKVDYVNGRDELAEAEEEFELRVQNVSQMIHFDAAGLISYFDLNGDIELSSGYDVVFGSSETFANEVNSFSDVYLAVGNYYVSRNPNALDYRKVYAKLGTSSFELSYSFIGIPNVTRRNLKPAQTINYYVSNPDYGSDGLYSVDYAKGEIHTQRAMNSDWSISVDYEYTNYKIKYEIARKVESDFFTVKNDIVTISDKEILSKSLLPGIDSANYQISYDYIEGVTRDLSELKDYFTPVLKDYMLKVITKGNLI